MDLTIVSTVNPVLQEPYYPGMPLVSCFASSDRRFKDNSVDMGTGFDCLSPWANTNSSKISPEQMANRMILVSLMAAHNFTNYDGEWWHYSLQGEPFPETYFDFPIQKDCCVV